MNETLPENFFLSILQTLEELEIPYFVVGAFAAIVYGLNRVTYDVDIVVRLERRISTPLPNDTRFPATTPTPNR